METHEFHQAPAPAPSPEPIEVSLETLPQERDNIRAWLKDLSNRVKHLVKSQAYPSTNAALLDVYAQLTGAKTFHSRGQWKQEGYRVKPHQAGLPIWGRQKQAHRSSKESNGQKKSSGYTFFPVVQVYAESQVEPAPAGDSSGAGSVSEAADAV